MEEARVPRQEVGRVVQVFYVTELAWRVKHDGEWGFGAPILAHES